MQPIIGSPQIMRPFLSDFAKFFSIHCQFFQPTKLTLYNLKQFFFYYHLL